MTSTIYFIWAGRFLCVAVASRGGANRCELVCSRWRRAAHTPGAPEALASTAPHATERERHAAYSTSGLRSRAPKTPWLLVNVNLKLPAECAVEW